MTNKMLQYLLAIAIASNVLLAVQNWRTRREAVSSERALDSAQAAAGRVALRSQLERDAFVRAIGELPLTRPFLAGRSAVDSALVQLLEPADGLYYLMSPRCGACAVNLPFLDSLARLNHLRVVAFSRDGNVADLMSYAQLNTSQLTYLAAPHGYLDLVTPRWATPLTVVVLNSRVTSIIPGRIGDREKEELLAIAPQKARQN